MPDVTFEWGKAKITVREQTGRDLIRLPYVRNEIQQAYIEGIAPEEINDWDRVDCNVFASILMRSTVTGNLDFPWPSYQNNNRKELYDVFTRFMDSGSELIKLWLNALDDADLEALDPEE